MNASQRGGLVVIALLVAVVLLLLLFWKPGGASIDRLTDTVRKRVDDLASEIPAISDRQRRIDWSGDLTRWLIVRSTPEPEKEAELAAAVHQQLVSAFSQSRTPQFADDVFQKLLAEVPSRLLPSAFDFRLVVLQGLPENSLTVGGGYVYLQQEWLDSLGGNPEESGPALAFTLAHELGHICRGHSTRGHQLMLLQDAANSSDSALRQWIERMSRDVIKRGSDAIRFTYSDQQDLQADLFALHLCRNSGLDLERCLDALRLMSLQSNEDVANYCGFNTDSQPDTSISTDDLDANTLVILRRIRQFHVELSGKPESDEFGLFQWNVASGSMIPVANGDLSPTSRCVVFVHGMESGLEKFESVFKTIGDDSQSRLLGFRYPNDQSLARSAQLLQNEMTRVCGETVKLSFVCHSAGGLVTRYYREILGGRADRILFLGTPQSGSDLASLRPLLELTQVATSLRLGYPAALEQAIVDGDGQITFDLQPGSLFLRQLNRATADRHGYVIYRGRALNGMSASIAKVSAAGVFKTLKVRLPGDLGSSAVAETISRWADRLTLPDEITEGDLAVSLDSAELHGVSEMYTVKANHLELTAHPDAVAAIGRLAN